MSHVNAFDKNFKYVALLPLLIILLVLVLFPVGRLIVMSFSKVGFESGGLTWDFVGGKNYGTVAEDPTAIISLKNTIILAVVSVAVETFIGLIFALAVRYTKKLNVFYRSVIFFPVIMPPIAIGVMWLMLYQYDYGLINMLLAKFGVQGPAWLANKNLAFPAIIVVDIWHWTSFLFLILLAGLESIPDELSESAKVDGASELQIIRHIYLPILRPTIIVAVILRTIYAFKVFDEIYLLTSGGPGNRTQVISSYIMDVFFEQSRMGYAASLSLVTLAIVGIIIFLYLIIQSLLTKGSSRG
jgi:multiple sugar transport system permease protein